MTIQDISCFGQCSLTVALPIISACGVECCILPSAVLSTHTAGFTGYTFRDLTDDIPAIAAHWKREGISFDAIYTGYLGSIAQIEMVENMAELIRSEGLLIVDPAMGDNGKLYPGFDQAYADRMAQLCGRADIILPNVTECCYMTGIEFRENYDEEYVFTLMRALAGKGCRKTLLTGICYEDGRYGVGLYDSGTDTIEYYFHERSPRNSHGTGDVYSSAFVGALMKGKSLMGAAAAAADYTLECIKLTVDDPDHSYGVKFELALPKLIEKIQ